MLALLLLCALRSRDVMVLSCVMRYVNFPGRREVLVAVPVYTGVMAFLAFQHSRRPSTAGYLLSGTDRIAWVSPSLDLNPHPVFPLGNVLLAVIFSA